MRTGRMGYAAKPRTGRGWTRVPRRRQPQRLRAPELAQYRRALLQKRDEIVSDIRQMQAGGPVGAGGSPAAPTLMPTHMADLGSDTWEQTLTLGLVEDKRSLLREIDDALARLEAGGYGICEGTGRPISRKRLRAIPWTRYCIEHASRQEASRRRGN